MIKWYCWIFHRFDRGYNWSCWANSW